MGIRLPTFISSRRKVSPEQSAPDSELPDGVEAPARASLMHFALLVALAGSAIIAASSFFFFQQAREVAAESRRHEIQLTAENLADRIAAAIGEYGEKMDLLVRDPEIVRLASEGSEAGKRAKEAELGYLFPRAVRLRILPPGLKDVDLKASPPLSYAALDMLRQAETRETPPPAEVHMFGTPQQHINMVRRILDASGRRIVGDLMVSLVVPMLQEMMDAPRMPRGYGEIWQVAQGKSVTLATRGDRALRQGPPVVEVPIAGTRWKIAYWAGPVGASATFSGLLTVAGGAMLLFVLLVLLVAQRFRRLLQQDQTTLLGAVRDARNGRLQDSYAMQLKECAGSVVALHKLFESGTGAFGSGARVERLVQAMAQEQAAVPSVSAAPDFTVLDDSLAGGAASPAPAATTTTAPAIDPSIFRAYDIRGVVGETLNTEVVYQLGRAIASEAAARGESSVVVARDGRLSGPELSEALIRGLRDGGQNVKDIGMVPTPVLYFAAQYLDTRSGVMLTGSHNPPQYNGLKIVIAGETLSGDGIQALHRRIERGELASGSGELEQVDVLGDYIERIRTDVQVARPLKVVVDCGNGVAGVVAPRLLEALGCQVIPLFCEVDGHFPNHHPDPSKVENLTPLIEAVREQGADLGLAFDGDGDRLGVVASGGEIIWPDRLLMLFAMDILSRNPGADIIYDVKCSRHVAKIVRDFGGSPEMWKTGHSLIKARMKETGALLAGEMSGHVFFQERWFGFDDGLYAAARLLEILSNDHRDSSAMFGALPDSVNTPELQVMLQEGEPQRFMERLLEQAQFEDAEISRIDGLRADFSDGWGLVRASNTTPSLVLRFEADDEAALARIQGRFRSLMQAVEADIELPF
ncbi:phosphomannomutase/phosphoglucomutase [Thiohalobacter sp. IOR34]|uniref:phosphomannomutase/phosphoglucomutase n=1 Tax=Thiohalobacter sp. IOR34 TaxID=3057176 RepID=UPI0025AFEAF8|nr:phosphomannomutase/phosphoglucomutase [Thiohalobacter sp. IOR34]WJW75767.1 phosphomannomutase/phosphoglucomutase [Thiohalobacter sp. IOR34]